MEPIRAESSKELFVFDGEALTCTDRKKGKLRARIPIAEMTAVRFKPARTLWPGDFEVSAKTGGVLVLFDAAQQPAFELLRDALQAAMAPLIATGEIQQSFYAHGTNGDIHFDGSVVTLTRSMRAVVLGGTSGARRMPIGSITAVRWKPADLAGGYISFSFAGGTEFRAKEMMREMLDADADPNTVTFRRRHEPDMIKVRDAIEAAIAERDRPKVAPTQPAGTPMERITQLRELHHAGLISGEEFERRKQAIIESI